MSTFLWIVGGLFGLAFASMLLLPLMAFIANRPSTNNATPINRDLSNQYYWQDGKAVYVIGGNFFQVGEKDMPEHDPQTFEVIARNYAKDKNHVFYLDQVIEGADPASVEVIEDPIAKKSRDGLIAAFIKDANHVFWAGSIVDGAAPQTFSAITHTYVHDNSNLYYGDNRVAKLSGPIKSLHIDFSNDYLAMGDSVFYNGRLTEANASSFEQIKDDYFRDHKAVFRRGEIIDNADPETYQILNSYFHKDKNRCFYLNQPLAHCDAGTFIVFKGDHNSASFAKDAYNVYYETRIVTNEKPEKFNNARAEELGKAYRWHPLRINETHVTFVPDDQVESVGPYWAHDGRLYTDQRRLEHIKADDIQQYGNSRYFLIKASHIEYNMQPIQDADITSFEIINNSFAKDKNRIYYENHPVEGIEPEEYQPREGDYAKEAEDGIYRPANQYDDFKDSDLDF